MTTRRISCDILLIATALLAVAGCGSRARNVDRLDRDLLNRAVGATTAQHDAPRQATGAASADPALTRALADQIIVDPAVVRRAADHGEHPAAHTPPRAAVDATRARADRPKLGELARSQAAGQGAANCYATLSYGRRWATRLPPALPLPPDATVSEAAGSEVPGCHTRVVSFASATTAPRLAGFYARRGKAAGYDTGIERRGGEVVVAGNHPADDRAYVVTLSPRANGGTDVDIVSNDGR